MATNLNDIINFTGTNSDFEVYPNMDKRYGPYTSVEQALTKVTKPLRSKGVTVGILGNGNITEYWFHTGVEDHDLVPKNGGHGSCCCDDTLNVYEKYVEKGGRKTEEQFADTLKRAIDNTAFINLFSNIDNAKVTVTLKSGEVTTIGTND